MIFKHVPTVYVDQRQIPPALHCKCIGSVKYVSAAVVVIVFILVCLLLWVQNRSSLYLPLLALRPPFRGYAESVPRISITDPLGIIDVHYGRPCQKGPNVSDHSQIIINDPRGVINVDHETAFHVSDSDPEHRVSISRGGIAIRYAMLSPVQDLEYLRTIGLPSLAASSCLVERFLTPTWRQTFHVMPTFVIYTDDFSHTVVTRFAKDKFGKRGIVINLDTSLAVSDIMKPFRNYPLDVKNYASVRRSLADTIFLPAGSPRLLLGTDVSFLKVPYVFLWMATSLKPAQAFYGADRPNFQGELYSIRDFKGPQCRGLFGDFIYLGPGVDVTLTNLLSKMLWYAQVRAQNYSDYPNTAIKPACKVCPGLHAIDQFGLVMALGEATQPQGHPSACFALNESYYSHWYTHPTTEAVHDKSIRRCKMEKAS